MYFTGPHLRVTTPLTTNGMIPKIEMGEQQFKTDFFPLSARKAFEGKRNRLIKNGFKHLAPEIEVVGEEISKPKKK